MVAKESEAANRINEIQENLPLLLATGDVILRVLRYVYGRIQYAFPEQYVAATFDECSTDVRESLAVHVCYIVQYVCEGDIPYNDRPKAIHDALVGARSTQGWRYGAEFSAKCRTSPAYAEWGNLGEGDRRRDVLICEYAHGYFTQILS